MNARVLWQSNWCLFLLKNVAFEILTKANWPIYISTSSMLFSPARFICCTLICKSLVLLLLLLLKYDFLTFLRHSGKFIQNNTYSIFLLLTGLTHILISETVKLKATCIQWCSWEHFILSCTLCVPSIFYFFFFLKPNILLCQLYGEAYTDQLWNMK